jgi:hypothetical protein
MRSSITPVGSYIAVICTLMTARESPQKVISQRVCTSRAKVMKVYLFNSVDLLNISS